MMIDNQNEFEQTFKSLQECAQSLESAMMAIEVMSQDVLRIVATQKISVAAGKIYLTALIQEVHVLRASCTDLHAIQKVATEVDRLQTRFLQACGEEKKDDL